MVKNLQVNFLGSSKLTFRWEVEKWPRINNPALFKWNEREIKVESSFLKAPFEGLRWSTFILSEACRPLTRLGFSLEYNTPMGIIVKVRRAWPNLEEPSMDDYYDPFGRRRSPDNCVDVIGQFVF